MRIPFVRLVLGTVATLAAAAVLAYARQAADAVDPEDATAAADAGVERASRYFLTLVLLPGWVIPGFGDYLCHRAAKIERTSGTHESLTHALMIASTGVGVLTGLFFKVNACALLVMGAATIAHEGVVLWDVGYAARLRPPSATEQHLHSFLEVLPFAGLAFTCCLHPDAVAVLLGREPRPAQWRLCLKRRMSLRYNAAIVLLITTLVVLPNIEEFVRCYRVDRTLLPHQRPIEGSTQA